MADKRVYPCGCVFRDNSLESLALCAEARRWESRWADLFNADGFLRDIEAAQAMAEHYMQEQRRRGKRIG